MSPLFTVMVGSSLLSGLAVILAVPFATVPLPAHVPVAEISAEPMPVTVTRPLSFTVATFSLELLHWTFSKTVKSYLGFVVSCTVGAAVSSLFSVKLI